MFKYWGKTKQTNLCLNPNFSVLRCTTVLSEPFQRISNVTLITSHTDRLGPLTLQGSFGNDDLSDRLDADVESFTR